jgi:hypothetical protein
VLGGGSFGGADTCGSSGRGICLPGLRNELVRLRASSLAAQGRTILMSNFIRVFGNLGLHVEGRGSRGPDLSRSPRAAFRRGFAGPADGKEGHFLLLPTRP